VAAWPAIALLELPSAATSTGESTSTSHLVNNCATECFTPVDDSIENALDLFAAPSPEPSPYRPSDNQLPEDKDGGTVAAIGSGPDNSDNVASKGAQAQSDEPRSTTPGDFGGGDGASSGPGLALASTAAPGSGAAAARARYGQAPLTFEPNQGQTGSGASYLARGLGYNLFLSATETTLGLQKRLRAPGSTIEQRGVLRMQLVGANPLAQAQALEQQPGRSNYVHGRNPSQWRLKIPNFAKVRYVNVYPGIDTQYYGTNQRQVEFDFIVHPGANPGSIRLAYPGVTNPRLDAQGGLVLSTPGGDVVQRAPVLYQLQGSTRQPVAGRYTLFAGGQVGFQIQGAYDAGRVLYVDPVLDYSDYLGGSGEDSGEGIAVASDGTAYVVGTTTSPDLPPPIVSSYVANGDAFVTKLDPAGIPVYTTYFGGTDEDTGQGIALLPNSPGELVITGSTRSPDLPFVGTPYQPFLLGLSDAYAARFNSADGTPLYVTYLGGDGDETGKAIAIDEAGDAYLTGWTDSPNFPTPSGFQREPGGGTDAFVARLDPTGSSLVYGSYLGGSDNDEGWGIAVDSAGQAHVTGKTTSGDFPNPAAYQPDNGGCMDAFIAKVEATGSALVYATYYGGSGDDESHSLALDSSGNVYIAGMTASTDLPIYDALQIENAGGHDAFVMKFDVTGTGLVFATYLGGTGNDNAFGIAVDDWNRAYLIGETTSLDFPTEAPIQPASGGGTDAFVTAFSESGLPLRYSTYHGGIGTDLGKGIAVDASRNAYVTGSSDSDDLPLANAFQGNIGGGTDAFVARVNSGVIAHADSYAVGHDRVLEVVQNALIGGVLNNDEEPAFLELSAVLDASTTNGLLGLDQDGSFTYTPNPLFFGTDSFVYHATNGSENSNSVTVTINVYNTAPVGKPDLFSLAPDTSATLDGIDILGNDTDAEDVSFTASLVSGSGPTYGTLDYFDPDGSFRYTPSLGFVGTDTFQYMISDGILQSLPILVTLAVQIFPAVDFINNTRGGDLVVSAGIAGQSPPPGSKEITVRVVPAGTTAQLTLSRTEGAEGDAIFGNGTTSMNVQGKQKITIYGWSASSVPRNMRIEARVNNVVTYWYFTVFSATLSAFVTGPVNDVPEAVRNHDARPLRDIYRRIAGPRLGHNQTAIQAFGGIFLRAQIAPEGMDRNDFYIGANNRSLGFDFDRRLSSRVYYNGQFWNPAYQFPDSFFVTQHDDSDDPDDVDEDLIPDRDGSANSLFLWVVDRANAVPSVVPDDGDRSRWRYQFREQLTYGGEVVVPWANWYWRSAQINPPGAVRYAEDDTFAAAGDNTVAFGSTTRLTQDLQASTATYPLIMDFTPHVLTTTGEIVPFTIEGTNLGGTPRLAYLTREETTPTATRLEQIPLEIEGGAADGTTLTGTVRIPNFLPNISRPLLGQYVVKVLKDNDGNSSIPSPPAATALITISRP
jgi:hypothetical protein